LKRRKREGGGRKRRDGAGTKEEGKRWEEKGGVRKG